MGQRGFTLLEILVVVAMIAIAASAVVISFSGESPYETAKQHAQRFRVSFTMASDYSVLNQRSLGLFVDNNRYRFVTLDEQQVWQYIDEEILAAAELPDGLNLTLELDQLPWKQDNRLVDDTLFDEENSFDQLDGDEKEPIPQVLILPSGEITPFRLSFEYQQPYSNEQVVTLHVDGEYWLPLTLRTDEEAL